MMVLKHKDSQRLDLLFGLGVIGNEVLAKVRRAYRLQATTVPFSWEPALQVDSLARLSSIVKQACEGFNRGAGVPRLNVLWAAGRGGFDLDPATFEAELTSFRHVVDFAADFEKHSGLPVAFHMLSSAGGLYEGQTGVSPHSTPDPRRPYGTLKLAQEAYLKAACTLAGRHIYRPSTVYGFSGFEKRMGLVAKLIWGKTDGRLSSVFVPLQTIRDYLFVGDVARYVAGKMALAEPATYNTYILASGKPTSIGEVIRTIDRVVPGRAYLHLRPRDFNRENNSFSPQVVAEGLRPTDLETGIRIIYSQMISQGRW